jgi:PelA/Pel-15E family pectate lyase
MRARHASTGSAARLLSLRMHRLSFFVSSLAFASVAVATDAPHPWTIGFEPVTALRISHLPAAERPAWEAYWAASGERAQRASGRGQEDFSPDKPLATPLHGAAHSKGLRLDESPSWYAREEARVTADRVVIWQTAAGGWMKTSDYTRQPVPADKHSDVWSAGTFDNDATITELVFLANVISAADSKSTDSRAAQWRESFLRGLDYTLSAQFPNGGFPQIYPLVGGYHDAITFNDDAMVHILDLCREISRGEAIFRFVPADVTARAGRALDRGIACVLATQIKDAKGELTVWCQQHDPLTLQPCAARNFEPAAQCSAESAGLLRFLMALPHETPEVARAIDAAATWLRAHAMHDVAWDRTLTTGNGLVREIGAPALWARYYELGTGRPIFGDRDRTIHYVVTELSAERRNGYQWFNSHPAAVLNEYDKPRQTK